MLVAHGMDTWQNKDTELTPSPPWGSLSTETCRNFVLTNLVQNAMGALYCYLVPEREFVTFALFMQLCSYIPFGEISKQGTMSSIIQSIDTMTRPCVHSDVGGRSKYTPTRMPDSLFLRYIAKYNYLKLR